MDPNKEEKLKEDRICPICLHVWNDPTVLDNCTHIFCFECIIEWTRLKPECPLCKCSLQLVKHQLKDGTALLPTWETNGKIENVIELRSEHEFDQIMKVSAARAPDVEKHAIIQVAKNLMGELHSLRSHSITTFASESIYRRAIEEIDLELNEYKHLLNSINQGVSRATLFNEPAFRRIIYKKNLMPNSISPPMFNVSFNKEYIQNHREAVRSHIMPFIVREVTALTRKEALDIGTYLDRLLDYFTGKIKRQGIVTFLTKKGIENPHQFVNNLLHYASAGQTLHVYDQNSEYTQRRTNYVGAFIPEDDDVLFLNSNSDVEVIGESGGGAQNRRRWAQNEQPTAINNNLLLDHFQQQQQPGTSASTQDRPNGDGGGNERGGGSSFVSRLQAMLSNFGQNFNQNRPSTSPDYFYSPPMRASHHYRPQSPRQEQQPSSSSGAGAMNANQRATFSEANTNLRQHDSTIQFDDSNDDSDDGVECIGVVPKKRREMPEPENNSSTNNDNNDDGEDELMLMDEYEEDEQQQ